MNRRQFSATLLFFAANVVSVVFTPAARAEEAPRWKFAPGRAWTIVLERETTTETTQPGGSSKTTATTTLDLKWVVESVDGDVAQIKQSIERVRASVEVQTTDSRKKTTRGDRAEYDSASTARVVPAAAKKLKARWDPQVGSSKTFAMDGSGTIKGDTLVPLASLPTVEAVTERKWSSETTTRFGDQAATLRFAWELLGESANDTLAWQGTGAATLPPRDDDAEGPTPSSMGQTVKAEFSRTAGMLTRVESTTTIAARDTLRDKPIDTKTIVHTTGVFVETPAAP